MNSPMTAALAVSDVGIQLTEDAPTPGALPAFLALTQKLLGVNSHWNCAASLNDSIG
jgi:hypothetical protein